MLRARLNDQFTIKTTDENTFICEFEVVEIDEDTQVITQLTKELQLSATSATPHAELMQIADTAITNWID